MRFLMFDRITEFQKNQSICGTKQVSLESGALERVNDDLIYPVALAIESLAQIGGWLACISRDFTVLAVLAMLVNIRIDAPIYSGDELILQVNAYPGYDRADSVTVSGEICRAGLHGVEYVLQIEKLVYGIFPNSTEKYIQEQQRLFAVLSRGMRC